MTVSTPPPSLEISGLYVPFRPAWLAVHEEPALDPTLPIVDAHHHLWDRPGSRYLLDEFVQDLATGHNILQTVFVECRSMYRASVPKAFGCIGEVEFVNGIAAMSASGGYGPTRVAAAIVGSLDLREPQAAEILESLLAAAPDRLRGVRQVSAWDPDPAVTKPIVGRTEGLLREARFLRGFQHLAKYGLSFDAFLFHTQLPELLELARNFPQTTIVLDHVGAPIGIGRYQSQRAEVFDLWRSRIWELSTCPNVAVKLGGLGMRLSGFDFHERVRPPTSVELAESWGPYFQTCIEAFGPSRCMFESNFPPDKGTSNYGVTWNAFKRVAVDLSSSERHALFSGTARTVYRLPDLP